MVRHAAAAAAIVVALLAALPSAAGTGDRGFGDRGWRLFGGYGGTISGIAVLPDGRIVANLDGGLVRLLPDGSLDRTFGKNGFGPEPRGSYADGDSYLVVQRDGRLVTAGPEGLVRYTAGGRFDTSFGKAGVVGLLRGNVSGLALAPDGAILVGVVDLSGEAFLRLYRPDGTPDASFGTAGVLSLALRYGEAARVAAQPDGKILVAAPGSLSRRLPDGSLDTGFGDGGFVTIDGGASAAPAMDAKGRILIAVLRIDPGGTGPDTRILRFLPDGRPDATFGDGGVTVRRSDRLVGVIKALAPLPDGEIAFAGTAQPLCSFCKGANWLAGRVTADGDWTLGPEPGLIARELDCWGEGAESLAVQPDGKMLVGGDACGDTLVLGRYTPALALDRGPRLTLRAADPGPRIAAGTRTIRVSATVVVSDAANIAVAVRRGGGVRDARLLAGSTLGATRLKRPARSIGLRVRRGARVRLTLVLPRPARSVPYAIRIDAADDRGRSVRLRLPFRTPAAG